MTDYGYRDASPWDVLTKPTPVPVRMPAKDPKPKRTIIRSETLLDALRKLGPSTPAQLAEATRLPFTRVSLALARLTLLGEHVTRVAQGGANRGRDTFVYSAKEPHA